MIATHLETQLTTRGQFLRHRDMNRVIFLGYILQSLPYILGISRQVIPIRRDKKVNQKRQKSKQYIIHTFLKTVC